MTYTNWQNLTLAIKYATSGKVELAPYKYDDNDRICDEYHHILPERYDKFPESQHLAAVKLEKRNGRHFWVPKDAILALARQGWPKSECFVCGEKIPYKWHPDIRKWAPNHRLEAEHAVGEVKVKWNRRRREVVGPDGGSLCYEQLASEKPPNEGRSPRYSFLEELLDSGEPLQFFQVKDLQKENACGD